MFALNLRRRNLLGGLCALYHALLIPWSLKPILFVLVVGLHAACQMIAAPC
jgi:hypothetical protein